MKKMIAVFLLLLIPMKVNAISAESAVAIDIDSGRVLYEKNADKEKLIASTTKIMSAIIALENASLDDKITVGEEVLKAYGSAIYIEMGEEITLKDLLYGLILRSGNDAAIEIAHLVTGGMDSFVYLMNQKAYELGMSSTIFYNNHGLEEENGNGNISTAKDMAKLMRYACNNEIFLSIASTENYTAKTSGKTYTWNNKNKLLTMYEYTIAGKTGYTEKALRTLVTAAKKDEKRITVVTLNDGNDFNDHKSLYETLFEKYELVTLIEKNNLKIESKNNGSFYLENDYKILLTEPERNAIKVTYELATREYQDNEQVGIAKINLNGKEIATAKVYYSASEIETKKEGWFSKLIGWLFGW